MNIHQFFPVHSNLKPGDLPSLIIPLLIYLVAAVVVNLIVGTLLGAIPLIGLIFRVVNGLFGLYCCLGIILSLLLYFNVISK